MFSDDSHPSICRLWHDLADTFFFSPINLILLYFRLWAYKTGQEITFHNHN